MRIIPLLLALFVLFRPLWADEPASLTLEKVIALPGMEGRFDHATLDPETHRLFFAALGNNTVEVIDVRAGKRLHTITGLKKPTGLLFLAGRNLVAVANGDDASCRFYDATSYSEKGRVTGVDDADNVRFDEKTQRVYLGYGAGALAVIDAATLKLTGSIKLPKHPESFQLEDDGTRIFVNVPDAHQIAVVDRMGNSVVATWLVTKFGANFPMALAESQRRVFIGCRSPARLVAFDTQSGKPVVDAALGGDIDDLFFDNSSSRLFASCGEGFIDVFRFEPPATLQRTDRIVSATGARTAFFHPDIGLCLAVPHRGEQRAEIRIYRLSPSARAPQ